MNTSKMKLMRIMMMIIVCDSLCLATLAVCVGLSGIEMFIVFLYHTEGALCILNKKYKSNNFKDLPEFI